MQGNCREQGEKKLFTDCCILAETNSSADSLCHKTEVACFSAEFKLRKIFIQEKILFAFYYIPCYLRSSERVKDPSIYVFSLHPSHELLAKNFCSHQRRTNKPPAQFKIKLFAFLSHHHVGSNMPGHYIQQSKTNWV